MNHYFYKELAEYSWALNKSKKLDDRKMGKGAQYIDKHLVSKFIKLYVERCRFMQALAFWQFRAKLPACDKYFGKEHNEAQPTLKKLFDEMVVRQTKIVNVMANLADEIDTSAKKKKNSKVKKILEPATPSECDSPTSPIVEVPER